MNEPRDLVAEVARLTTRTEELTTAVENLDLRAAKAERISKGAAFIVILAVVALLALGWVAAGQQATANRLESLIQRSLCPVFALVVGGYDPTTRPLNSDGTYIGSPREAYDKNAKVMQASYSELDCASPIVPKRAGS